VLAHYSNAIVHTIEISKELADIAHKIHEHAGLGDRIKIHVGTVSTSQ
jgi:predicted O-methyltransferase YrrM